MPKPNDVSRSFFGAPESFGALPDSGTHGRDLYIPLIRSQAQRKGLPPEVADAVAFVESGYDPRKIGSVGEIGLMQLRPTTASMLGFRGSDAELAAPEVNIFFGVEYLAKAWRLAGGDLCRTLMKYRAGHGEEQMTPRSIDYCARARAYMARVNSSTDIHLPEPEARFQLSKKKFSASKRIVVARRVPKNPRQFWAIHEARIRYLTQQVHAKWRRITLAAREPSTTR